jgi:hypothetical protein
MRSVDVISLSHILSMRITRVNSFVCIKTKISGKIILGMYRVCIEMLTQIYERERESENERERKKERKRGVGSRESAL